MPVTIKRMKSNPKIIPNKKIIYSSILLTLAMLMLIFSVGRAVYAQGDAQTRFKRIPLQYIVALGDPSANSGSGAESWGLWRQDPGPRGCRLDGYDKLKADGGVAPARWKFDSTDWWLEEHGLIMEKPEFPLPPGRYLVTGGRAVKSVLTVYPKDNNGAERWALDKGVRLYDVTHLPCRAARYTPAKGDDSCSPDKVNTSSFPVTPTAAMPPVEGCHKKDYAVLFVIGMAVEDGQ